MKMLAITTAALVAALSPTPAAATETGEPPPAIWTGNITVGVHEVYASQYNGLLWFDGPVIQSSITIAHQSGFYATVWGSTGTDGSWSANWDDELDYTLGWAGELGFLGLEADVSVSYWDCFQVGSQMNDYWAFTAKVSRPFEWRGWSVEPSIVMQLAWQIGDQTVWPDGTTSPAADGSVWGVNLSASRDLCRWCGVTLATGVFFDGGSYGFEDAIIWESSASLDWKLAERVTLSLPSLHVSSPLSSTDRDTIWCWGASLSIDF
jgi:hypothetical protein